MSQNAQTSVQSELFYGFRTFIVECSIGICQLKPRKCVLCGVVSVLVCVIDLTVVVKILELSLTHTPLHTINK